MGHQCCRHSGRDPDRGRLQCRNPGAAGRSALRRDASLPAAIPRYPRGHRKCPPARALRASASLWRSSPTSTTDDGAEAINREGGQRYIAIKFSVEGRDLGSTVEEAISKVEKNVKLPTGYHLEWAGEYASQKRARQAHGAGDSYHCARHLPDPLHHVPLLQVVDGCSHFSHDGFRRRTARALLTHTNFSVSSAVGFLALFGVSVETGVIMIEFINQLRTRYRSHDMEIERANR